MSGVQSQHTRSSKLSSMCTSLKKSQISRYSRITCTVRAPEMSKVQRLLVSASATVRSLFALPPTALERHGAMHEMERPCNQRSVQKRALRPFPISTEIEASNLPPQSCLSHQVEYAKGEHLQNVFATTISCEERNQKRWRSIIPKPPRSGGRQTLDQASKQ